MQFKTLKQNPTLRVLHTRNHHRLVLFPAHHNSTTSLDNHSLAPNRYQNQTRVHVSSLKSKLLKFTYSTVVSCTSPSNEVVDEIIENHHLIGKDDDSTALDGFGSMEVLDLKKISVWKQMKEIVMFSGPATGLWICSPLMSLIDTAVIGQGSSVELAALGPGTVLCDHMSFVFRFLSIATSNIVATTLARKDKKEVQHQISILLCVGLACGAFMLLFTKFFGTWALTTFAGAKNAHIVPAANKYVQIRGLAWPAILTGWVAQSSSLGMKDSWGPLKSLAVASTVNIIGNIVLCTFLGYGITGAAWATLVSQVIAAYMMVQSLNDKGYNAYAITVPSSIELFQIIKLAAPVLATTLSKAMLGMGLQGLGTLATQAMTWYISTLQVSFYSLMTYFATSAGTHTVAAHQVMIQMYSMCAVWGEPLSQTAQSFMPELLNGVNRKFDKAQALLKSLLIIGTILGLGLALVGTSVTCLFPKIFTSDPMVIQQMHKVLIPFFFALAITPCTHSLEGTLLAGRELKSLSLSMSGCFSFGALILLLVNGKGYGLLGYWCALVGFQWGRFFLSLSRLVSPKGVLYRVH